MLSQSGSVDNRLKLKITHEIWIEYYVCVNVYNVGYARRPMYVCVYVYWRTNNLKEFSFQLET